MLEATLGHLAAQTRPPDALHLCAVGESADLTLPGLPFDVVRVQSAKGATLQRNAIIERALRDGFDAVLFIDDDFLPANDYLERLEEILDLAPEVAMTTGTVIADGIKGPGYGFEEGLALLAADRPSGNRMTKIYNGYGCNMSVRLSMAEGLRFDEGLPLYGWLEDVDFSRQLAARGHIVRAEALRGVHLGVKSGRTKGRRLGYSQIANPVHLIRKGTMSAPRALRMMTRNVLSNAARARRPEPWVDRIGRLKGNGLAMVDLLRGRIDPKRAEEIEN